MVKEERLTEQSQPRCPSICLLASVVLERLIGDKLALEWPKIMSIAIVVIKICGTQALIVLER